MGMTVNPHFREPAHKHRPAMANRKPAAPAPTPPIYPPRHFTELMRAHNWPPHFFAFEVLG